MTSILAVGWGGFALVAVAVFIFFGGVYGYYTRHSRMDINQHPEGAEHEGSMGVGEGSSRISSGGDEDDTTFDQHGTR